MTQKPFSPAPGTRERLLDAAERLFAQHGFSGASVREITEAAGANLGAVNYHFRSKKDLYAEVFARRASQLREPLLAAVGEATALALRAPDQALQTLGGALLAPHESSEASQRLLALVAREAIEKRLPPGLFAREYLVPAINAITGVVRQIRPALPEATARSCAHAFFAQLMHIVKGAGLAVRPVEERLEDAVRFTVAGIRHIEAAPPVRPRRKVRRSQS
jgi:AcrR family transcriptional regulator